uniref:Uncharacterized protein n=1 Tax=Cucumis melo TaxID=3656 RepID=A0A9I9DLG3_CUCME
MPLFIFQSSPEFPSLTDPLSRFFSSCRPLPQRGYYPNMAADLSHSSPNGSLLVELVAGSLHRTDLPGIRFLDAFSDFREAVSVFDFSSMSCCVD